jgi:SSS family solute:Na+ symporter
MKTQLENTDFIVIAMYFGLLLVVVLYSIFSNRKKEGENSAGYFLGGRNLGWFVIGASLFASNIGSEHLVGLAGAGASGDFPAAQFELLAAFMLLLLGWLFVPFYLKSGVFTMPEFLEKRYSKWARGYLAWVSVVAYVLTKTSVTIAAGALIFTALIGIDFWTGAIAVVLITGLYTLAGGLKAVVYTDAVQMFILIGGAIAISIFGVNELDGWDSFTQSMPADHLNLWRPLSDPDFPWTGILIGAPILGIWYWCTDQFIVQRVLSTDKVSTARKATIFAGFLKVLPLFIFVVPGVIAYALSIQENPILTFPQINGETSYDAALPMLTMALLPSGLRGLVVSGLLAALMSSLSSVFNSCSTLFTIDIYKKYYPQTTDKQMVKVGRWATVVLIILSLAWIPMLDFVKGGLFQKLQSIQAYIAPPISAVFIFGVLSKQITAKATKYALLTGAAIGTLRLTLEITMPNSLGPFSWFVQINFMHFAIFLFALCSAVLFIISYRDPLKLPISKLNTLTLTYGKTANFKWSLNAVLSLILVFIIFIVWYVFS